MRRWLVPLLVLLAPAAARAAGAEAEHHGPQWGMLALQVLHTSILAGLLVWFLRKPLTEFLERRSRGIAEQIREAQARLDETRAELASARARMERVEEESAAIVAAAEQRAREESARAEQRAEHASERIREEARAVSDQEIARARAMLRAEAADLAIALAAELLERNLRPEDDRRLVRDFVERVAERS